MLFLDTSVVIGFRFSCFSNRVPEFSSSVQHGNIAYFSELSYEKETSESVSLTSVFLSHL